MCLAIPGRWSKPPARTRRDGQGRLRRHAQSGLLEHVPDAKVGDYCWCTSDSRSPAIDEAEARRVFEFLAEMKAMEELEVPSP